MSDDHYVLYKSGFARKQRQDLDPTHTWFLYELHFSLIARLHSRRTPEQWTARSEHFEIVQAFGGMVDRRLGKAEFDQRD